MVLAIILRHLKQGVDVCVEFIDELFLLRPLRTPYLSIWEQNRLINLRKPIKIHFHSNMDILKDSGRVGQYTPFSKPKFGII